MDCLLCDMKNKGRASAQIERLLSLFSLLSTSERGVISWERPENESFLCVCYLIFDYGFWGQKCSPRVAGRGFLIMLRDAPLPLLRKSRQQVLPWTKNWPVNEWPVYKSWPCACTRQQQIYLFTWAGPRWEKQAPDHRSWNFLYHEADQHAFSHFRLLHIHNWIRAHINFTNAFASCVSRWMLLIHDE